MTRTLPQPAPTAASPRGPTAAIAGALILTASLLTGCKTEHEIRIAPIEVKPIYATLDVNLRVKIERELDDVFAYEKEIRPAEGAKP